MVGHPCVSHIDKPENSLIKVISRGGLLYPSPDEVHVITVNIRMMNKICEIDLFQRSQSQRNYLVNFC